jgi:hypothetical protein
MNSLNQELERIRMTLSIAVNDLITWSERWAEAKPDFKEAEARAYGYATGTVQAREAQATLKSMKEYRAYLKAEAMKDVLKIKVDSLRAELSALQSQANIIKADRDLAMAAEHATNNQHDIYS